MWLHQHYRGQVDEANSDIRHEMRAMQRVGRILEVLFFVLSGSFGVMFVALTLVAIVGSSTQGVDFVQIIYQACSTMGLGINAAVFLVAGLVFRDISHGESPFNMKQARRIRIIAWLLLAYAFFDSVIPLGVVFTDVIDGNLIGVNRNVSGVPSIRIGTVLIAIVFFFLSSVFSYGVKLQELSDDVL